MRNNSITNKSKKTTIRFTYLIIFLIIIVLVSNNQLVTKNYENSLISQSLFTDFKVYENISYKFGANQDEYEKERCKLDLYIPENVKNFPVVVWFHGGSLKMGGKDEEYTKSAAKRFAEVGIAVAVVNYRLFPKIKYPAYIKDAAASVAWVIGNISKYGGNSKSVFICGHSAGAYLSFMLVLDPQFLKEQNVESKSIAGIIPIAGQTFTHYTIREEKGIPDPVNTPIIDEKAPCFNARKDTPPIFIVCSESDSPVTIAENKYLVALLNKIGNKKVSYTEIINRDHMTLITKIPDKNDPLFNKIIKFINENKSYKLD